MYICDSSNYYCYTLFSHQDCWKRKPGWILYYFGWHFFSWKGGKRFSSVLVIRWKNVFIDQKVSWFKRLWICQYKRFQLKKANPNIKICWNCVAYIQCDYERLLHGFSFFLTHAGSFEGIAQTPFSKKKREK